MWWRSRQVQIGRGWEGDRYGADLLGRQRLGSGTLSSEGFQWGNSVIGFVLLKDRSTQRTLGVSEGLRVTQL